MASLTLSHDIAAPVDTVFDVATDFEHAADNLRGISSLELLTPGPIGVGTRFRETRVFMGKEATEEMSITAFDPPNGYTVEAESHGMRYVSVFRLEPRGAACRLELTFDAQAQGFVTKVVNALFGRLMLGPMKKCVAEDFEDIAKIAEARAQSAPAQAES